jgi:hypothetical protein
MCEDRWPGRSLKKILYEFMHYPFTHFIHGITTKRGLRKNYEGWEFNSGNYLFTTDTK